MSACLFLIVALVSESPLTSFASAMRASWSHIHHSRDTSLPHPPVAKQCYAGRKYTRQPSWNSISRRPVAAVSVDDNGDDASLSMTIRTPARCSSRDAASIIKNSTSYDGLLLITCDASGRGGGSKHDGLAAILRIRHGASLPFTSTSQLTEGKEDLIDVTARRTVPSRKSSEVAAIALGMKRAMCAIPSSWRKQVLIISDSEYALDFFCGSENAHGTTASQIPRVMKKRKKRKGTVSVNRGKTTQTVELREEAHRRTLLSLMEETPKGIMFAKVRSSSRGVGISTNIDKSSDGEVDDTSWDGIGFIDHDAADYLSSITRSIVNSNGKEKPSFCMVKSLREEDIAWLENSDSDQIIRGNKSNRVGSSEIRSNDFWRTMEVVGSEARDERQKRNQRRTEIIQGMLGPSLQSSPCDWFKQRTV